MQPAPPSPRPPRRQAGFTLAEMLISLLVLVLVMGIVLSIFVSATEVADVQSQLAEAQQSLRIGQYDMTRMVRMAARGGLPAPRALAVRTNVGDDAHIGDADSPLVVEDTDVLTVRGILTTPVYQVTPPPVSFAVDEDDDGSMDRGTLVIETPHPTSGLPQDLGPLADAVEDTAAGDPEALIVVSPLDDSIYAVVELAAGGMVERDAGVVKRVTLAFEFAGGGTRVDAYRALSPLPNQVTTILYAGILEEYRFYIREEHAIPGDDSSELTPRLAVGRFYPNTDDPYLANASNAAVDIADNLLDLQVAIAIDQDGNGLITEDEPPSNNDDWIFNSGNDDPGVLAVAPRIFYVRMSSLARTSGRDLGYVAEPIARIEDRIYDEPAVPVGELAQRERMFRRRLLSTVIDLRNLS